MIGVRFLVALLGIAWSTLPAAADEGVVVLQSLGCFRIIVAAADGYILADWYGGLTVDTGDRLIGNLHSLGFQTVYLQNRGNVRLWIEDFWASQDKAAAYYYAKCR